MKIMCIGGGPAGLYFAISSKLRNPGHQVSVIERNPAGVTHGWGVTFSDDLLDALYRTDPVSAAEIFAAPGLWTNQEVHVRDDRRGRAAAHLGGYGFAIGRKHLLDILLARARSLDVDLQLEREVTDLGELAAADLVVACDGANSRVRTLHGEHFLPRIETGRNKYIWLGTDRIFDSFMFAFEHTPAGWIWFHSYPFSSGMTTFIAECPPATWAGLGFDSLDRAGSLRLLEQIFAHHLGGHHLLAGARSGPGNGDPQTAPWVNFTRITNPIWYHDNVVLMGDAAHTTHFSVGYGTTLAMLDAICLAERLDAHDDLEPALHEYSARRQAELVEHQSAADRSAAWFENVSTHIDRSITEFSYSLWDRREQAPSWRYPVHLATQTELVRKLRRTLSAARNGQRARRRMQRCGTPARTRTRS